MRQHPSWISGGYAVASVTRYCRPRARAISSARTPGPDMFARSGSWVTTSTRVRWRNTWSSPSRPTSISWACL